MAISTKSNQKNIGTMKIINQSKFFNSRLKDLENYEFYNKIGKGKYSKVYEGMSLKTKNKVILKQLKPSKIFHKSTKTK